MEEDKTQNKNNNNKDLSDKTDFDTSNLNENEKLIKESYSDWEKKVIRSFNPPKKQNPLNTETKKTGTEEKNNLTGTENTEKTEQKNEEQVKENIKAEQKEESIKEDQKKATDSIPPEPETEKPDMMKMLGGLFSSFEGDKDIKSAYRKLVEEHNELVDEYNALHKEHRKYKIEAEVYKEAIQNILSGKEPRFIYRKYNKDWSIVDKVVFIVKKNRKGIASVEIGSILLFLQPDLNQLWKNPTHNISQALYKAVGYGRLERIHVQGSNDFIYLIPKKSEGS